MKIISLLTVATLSVSALMADEMSIKQEGVTYIKMLGKELKTNLMAHMKADPSGLEAIGFCTAKAMAITEAVNAKLPEGASVRRTALKTRNANNKPDAIDAKVMEAYNKKAMEKSLQPDDIQVVEAGDVTRVYKPLMIKAACMKCHGDIEKINPDIKAVITKAYPKDMATGFKEGDFRGVIVAEIKHK